MNIKKKSEERDVSEKKEFFHWFVSPFQKKKTTDKNERVEEGIKKMGHHTQMGTGCVGHVGCGVQTTGSSSSSSPSPLL